MRFQSKLHAIFILSLLLPIFIGFTSPTHAYTPCAGIQPGDEVEMELRGVIKSTGEVFQPQTTTSFTIESGALIPGFYEEVLGMKIGESKEFEVPPSKGYQDETDPRTGDLVGKTLVFDVLIISVSDVYISDTDCDQVGSGFGSTLLNIFGWIAGIAVVGFIGISLYLQLQKTTTAACKHCKENGRSRLSEGKCGKCGNHYCRASFARGCPNCGSNTFVPKDR